MARFTYIRANNEEESGTCTQPLGREVPTLKVYSTEEVLKFMTKHYGGK